MSLLDDASIVITPNGVKVSTLFAVIPSDGAADMDFTRATTATRIDENGNIVSVGDGVPRIDYTGGGCPHILAEPQRTNIVFPSDVAVTQTRTVTAVAYALSFYGTGSIVLSGTHSATLTGTGVNDRVDLIFTPTAGSLVLTVSGTVTNFQLEEGSYATSYIPTSGSTVTRNQDIFTRDGIGSLINSTEGTFMVDISAFASDSTDKRISLGDGTSSNRIVIGYNAANEIQIFFAGTSGSFTPSYVIDITQDAKVAVSWSSTKAKFYVNGSPILETLGDFSFAADTLTELSFDNGIGTLTFFGKARQLQVYTTALTDPQLAALTS